MEKENVLAVFRYTPTYKFPDELKESSWNDTTPESIRNDRDILLARLHDLDLKSPYSYTSSDPALFRIPDQLLDDKEIVIAVVVDRYPEVLKQDVLPKELLDDKDVFRAFIRSPRTDYEAISDLLQKFSSGIRGNADLMKTSAAYYYTPLFRLSVEEEGNCITTEMDQEVQHSFVLDIPYFILEVYYYSGRSLFYFGRPLFFSRSTILLRMYNKYYSSSIEEAKGTAIRSVL